MGGDDCQVSKYFVDDKNIVGNKVYVSGQDYNHIKNVLRLSPGENIIVSNGKNREYEVKIIGFRDNIVTTEILETLQMCSEPSVKITLFQGIPKGEKMELIIQKTVEIGVFKVIPVVMERVIVKLDSKSSLKKTERWRKVSEQAAKQSGRNIVPEIEEPVDFVEAVGILKNLDVVFVLYEKEYKITLKDLLINLPERQNEIGVLIGPEGGFSDREIDLLREFNIVSLGPRILRTETAGLIASAIILFQMGDLG